MIMSFANSMDIITIYIYIIFFESKQVMIEIISPLARSLLSIYSDLSVDLSKFNMDHCKSYVFSNNNNIHAPKYEEAATVIIIINNDLFRM